MAAVHSLAKSSFRLAAAALMISGYVRVNGLMIGALIANQYGGHSQYLTMQGLAIAVATMLTGVVVDFLPSLTFLRALRRYLFVTAMPLAVVISSIYWPLLLLFPELIIAQDFSASSAPSSSATAPEPFFLPLSIDLALHACPAIALVIDFFAFESKYSAPEVNFNVPFIMGCYGLFYSSWVEFCASKNGGIFPYPFLTQGPPQVRLAIYVGAVLLGVLSFHFLNQMHPRS